MPKVALRWHRCARAVTCSVTLVAKRAYRCRSGMAGIWTPSTRCGSTTCASGGRRELARTRPAKCERNSIELPKPSSPRRRATMMVSTRSMSDSCASCACAILPLLCCMYLHSLVLCTHCQCSGWCGSGLAHIGPARCESTRGGPRVRAGGRPLGP
jgi:hypothetical protein